MIMGDHYQELIEEMNELRCLQGTNLPGSENIIRQVISAMDRADVLVQGTITPAENMTGESNQVANALLASKDAHFLSLASMLIKGETQAIDANLDTFSATVFTENVLRCLQNSGEYEASGSCDWTKLEAVATSCFRDVPSYDYALGTFRQGEVRHKVRRPKEQRERRVETEKKRPENVRSVDKTEDQVEATVQKIYSCLLSKYKKNGSKAIGYFQFVVDPTSFGYTVENIFHLSFLVKDGYVELSLDDDGLPVLKPRSIKKDVASSSSALNNNQMIISLNMDEWEEAIKLFNIKSPMIKIEREEEEDDTGPAPSARQKHR